VTRTPPPSPSVTPTIPPTPSVTPTIPPTPSVTTSNPTPTPTISITPTITITPTRTPSVTPTKTPTPSVTRTPVQPSQTPTASPTRTPTPSVTPTRNNFTYRLSAEPLPGNFFPPEPNPGPWAGYEAVVNILVLPQAGTGLPPLTAHLWFNPLPETFIPSGPINLCIGGTSPSNQIASIEYNEAYVGTYFGVSTAANSRIYTTDFSGNPLIFPSIAGDSTIRIIR
jgi:hypothetical protein